MRELVKLMIIPITGCVAIAALFLLVLYGGFWEDTLYKPEGMGDGVGLATKDLSDITVDDTLTNSGKCDPNLYRPCCGFDGVTYDNPCWAVKAGTQVAHYGMCGSR